MMKKAAKYVRGIVQMYSFFLSGICRLFEGGLRVGEISESLFKLQRRLYGKTNDLSHDLLEGEWRGIFTIMLAHLSLCPVRVITSPICDSLQYMIYCSIYIFDISFFYTYIIIYIYV